MTTPADAVADSLVSGDFFAGFCVVVAVALVIGVTIRWVGRIGRSM